MRRWTGGYWQHSIQLPRRLSNSVKTIVVGGIMCPKCWSREWSCRVYSAYRIVSRWNWKGRIECEGVRCLLGKICLLSRAKRILGSFCTTSSSANVYVDLWCDADLS